jgi:methionine synthase I (cobalamin-dependent)
MSRINISQQDAFRKIIVGKTVSEVWDSGAEEVCIAFTDGTKIFISEGQESFVIEAEDKPEQAKACVDFTECGHCSDWDDGGRCCFCDATP